MDTVHDWHDKIIHMIEQVGHDHPELVKYLDEMPITIPDDSDPHITIGTLKEFYESLLNIQRTNNHRPGKLKRGNNLLSNF